MSDRTFYIHAALLIASFLAIVIPIAVYDSRQWEAFKTAHNCKVVARIKGDIFNTFSTGSNGQMQVGVGSTPDKTGWLCDDGITYYR